MNQTLHALMAAAVVCLVTCLPGALAQDDKKSSPPGATERAKGRSMYPFRGTVASVDTTAKTIGIARQEGAPRVLKVGPDTSILRDGADVTLESVKTGDYLKGRVERQNNGDEIIVKATAGMKPERGPAEEDRPKRSKKDTASTR